MAQELDEKYAQLYTDYIEELDGYQLPFEFDQGYGTFLRTHLDGGLGNIAERLRYDARLYLLMNLDRMIVRPFIEVHGVNSASLADGIGAMIHRDAAAIASVLSTIVEPDSISSTQALFAVSYLGERLETLSPLFWTLRGGAVGREGIKEGISRIYNASKGLLVQVESRGANIKFEPYDLSHSKIIELQHDLGTALVAIERMTVQLGHAPYLDNESSRSTMEAGDE